jgi:Transglutaminase-like superfamily/Coenzyme PQQ synthesis protein D (PqqD)
MAVDVFHKTSHVRSRIVDGLAVILDLRLGNYVIFDKVATAMWRVLLTTGPLDRVPILEQKFAVPAQQLAADLDTFSKQCVQRGFLAKHPAPPVGRRTLQRALRRPTALRAWWSLLATTRALRSQGFSSIYHRYSRFAKPVADDGEFDDLVQRAERAFARAEHFFVMRAAPKDCLPRSLALYQFMLSVGVPVDHCIGVIRFPFASHAWVECRGRVLNDSEANVRFYAELARI